MKLSFVDKDYLLNTLKDYQTTIVEKTIESKVTEKIQGTQGLAVDEELSDTSTQAIANKTVKEALDGKADSSHTHTVSEITDFPSSMPASDVSDWAKASTKPTYSKSDVGLGNVDNTADADKTVAHANALTGMNYANPTNLTWGNQTGTAIAHFSDASGGGLGFRRDNPSSGQMSLVIDGTVYVNEGQNKVATESQIPSLSSLIKGADLNSSNPISNTNPAKLASGNIAVHTVYNGSGPANYGNLFNIGGSGGGQIFYEWSGSQTAAGDSNVGGIWYRSMRDSQSGWTAWNRVITSNCISVSGTTATITF